MKLVTRIIIYLILAFALVIFGFYLSRKSGAPEIEENTSIVVERIEKVAKFIAVEAYISEIYSYKDYHGYDWSWLRKKALLRVNAKVSFGYDLKKLNIAVDSGSKTIRIGPLPQVEILSIDHTIDYFDLEEGVFNSFTSDDYNKINANAKEYIRKVAVQSDKLKEAAARENTMIEMMQTLAAGMGYQLIVVDQKTQHPVQ